MDLFGKRMAAPRDTSEDDLPEEERRRRRPRLPPDEAARFAPAVAGYWAVTPEGPWIVARQNERWTGEDGISAPLERTVVGGVHLVGDVRGRPGPPALSSSAPSRTTPTSTRRCGRATGARRRRCSSPARPVRPQSRPAICSAPRVAPAYRTLAERRRQMGVGARSHCDIVVDVDEGRGQLRAIGGNVRSVVSMKIFPLVRENGRLARADTGDEARPLFAHLQLRTAPANAD